MTQLDFLTLLMIGFILTAVSCSDRFWGRWYGTARWWVVMICGPISSLLLVYIWAKIFKILP